MNSTNKDLVIESNEFKEFSSFFLKYLRGSTTCDEAFLRATCTYRKLFKKIPYQNYQSFLAEFQDSQYQV